MGLAACGGTAEQTQTTGDGETQTAAEFTEGAYHGELPLVQPGEDNVITIGVNTNPRVSDYKNNALTKWLEEQTGVDLQFVQFAGTAKDAHAKKHAVHIPHAAEAAVKRRVRDAARSVEQMHPADHPDLIVRVWGWSGYFNELSREYQDHIIRRLEFTV